ncbi:uncharacterized protein LOC113497490 [Trichoplusia ni]|uniref:Uncharacterized protein LOC113497490 n=1 Tax=Trichoplusia ni TaxID=7111 RepID=A0A7E5VX47_TRINI|nr:uncharacterized protein LOC113497490 [Trichoplusia ni]
MAYVYVFSNFLLLVIVHETSSSLLSRFRFPHEYVGPPEMVQPDEWPQDFYNKLIDERPELNLIFGPLRQARLQHLPFIQTTAAPNITDTGSIIYEYAVESVPPLSDQYVDDDKETSSEPARQPSVLALTSQTNSSAMTGHNSTIASKKNNTRSVVDDLSSMIDTFTGPKVASCYTCNKWPLGIPSNPSCHEAFQSDDWRYRTMRRFFRAHCFQNMYRTGWRVEPFTHRSVTYTNDKGLKRGYYGNYEGGCYKRFTDVSVVYTSRGCRSYWPGLDRHFLSHKFARLEVMLKEKKDACIASPHASLTPLARGISLFSRHHVCVCAGRYCNAASINNSCKLFLFIGLAFVSLFNFN